MYCLRFGKTKKESRVGTVQRHYATQRSMRRDDGFAEIHLIHRFVGNRSCSSPGSNRSDRPGDYCVINADLLSPATLLVTGQQRKTSFCARMGGSSKLEAKKRFADHGDCGNRKRTMIQSMIAPRESRKTILERRKTIHGGFRVNVT